MKIVNTDGENLHIFWTTWGISMKFSGKLWLMIILKAKKIKGFHLWGTFFLKNYGRENVVEKVLPDPFLKSQIWAYTGINSLSFIQFNFIACWGLMKYIQTKLQNTCFYFWQYVYCNWLFTRLWRHKFWN